MRRLVVFALPTALLAQPPRPTVGPIDTGRTVMRRDTTLANRLRITLAHVGRSPKALVRVVWATGKMRQCGLDVSSGGDSIGHMGGSLVVSPRPQRVDIGAEVLSDFIAPTIDLIAALVRTPRLDSTSNARGASGSADSAGMRVFRDAFTEQRSGSGCAPMGPAYTRVVVVGQFDDRVALSAITRAFADWRNPGERALDPVGHDEMHTIVGPPPLTLIHRAGAKQTAILVGTLAPDPGGPDYASFRVADAILGANVVSRITMNIREAKGYAYAPVSVLTTAPSGISSWVEIADVSTGVTAPALREILAEIKRLGAEEPPATEVEGGQRYLLGRYLVETATRTGWADDADLPTAASDTRRLVGVTSADVRRSAANVLASNRLSVVVVGDTIALGDQMAAIHALTLR